MVRINDRGPFVEDRIIDLSRSAAGALEFAKHGTAQVRVEYLGPAPAIGASPDAASTTVSSRPPKEAEPLFAPAESTEHLAEASQTGVLLQVGSFSELGNAHALRAKLQSIGPTFVKEAKVGGQDFFRVYISGWRDASHAERAKSLLKMQEGLDAVVTRLN